ncbi:GGDEF domain-containing protein [Vibrio sp. SCSIO 43140]|uniref:GGDEF domain-containing protein n=1 Tax=Vibrio sp. SCSIO 43140 TaxID=2819100 RepID=UPI002074B00A|nr:GGDEF domain-containing protein [Vibrio sp. SCSIO 43140]USD63666.1 GGDEF domain-containing protein [Vibrio sp. SCSIO 43140]
MDRLFACSICIATAFVFVFFTIQDVYSYVFEYIIQLLFTIVYLSGYLSFSLTVRCGFLLLIVHKLYECLEEVTELQLWLNQEQVVEFIFDDMLVLIGIFLIAKGILLTLEKQEYLLSKDPHTRSFNKLAIERIAQSEIDKGRASQSDTSILIIDIDNFKHFNDTYGHQLGDEALVAVTKHLQSQIRASDYLSRWGGDEFVIACPNTSQVEVVKLMKRIQQSANNVLRIQSVPIKLSIGAATSELSIDTFSHTLRKADRSLYQVKEQGRNGYKHYQENDIVSYQLS